MALSVSRDRCVFRAWPAAARTYGIRVTSIQVTFCFFFLYFFIDAIQGLRVDVDNCNVICKDFPFVYSFRLLYCFARQFN